MVHRTRFPLVRRHKTRSGTRKTTLLRIIATLIRPDGGRVRVEGYDVVTDP